MTAHTPSAFTSVRVWDLPTRLFHWLLVLCFVGAFVSVKIGGNAMLWHQRCGDRRAGQLQRAPAATGHGHGAGALCAR